MPSNLLFEIAGTFGSVVLAIVVFIVFSYLWVYGAITLHECAHWWVGRLVGFRPYCVIVGKGPLLWRKQLGPVRLFFYGSPMGGLMKNHIFDLSGLWWRGSLCVLAGPASDLLLLIAAGKAAGFLSASGFTPARTLGTLFGLAFCYQVIMLISGLLPLDVRRNDGVKSANDGRLFLGYLTGTIRKYLEARPAHYTQAVRCYDPTFAFENSWYQKADLDQKAAFDEAACETSPTEHEEMARKYLSLLSNPAMTKGEMAMILDSLASLALVRSDLSFRERAIVWARTAYDLFPNAATLRGTHGSALVESGEYQRGIEVLTPLTAEGNSVHDAEISSCYLAKAYARLGDADKAQEWLKRGRKSGAEPAH